MQNTDELLREIEVKMSQPSFWADPEQAKQIIQEYQRLTESDLLTDGRSAGPFDEYPAFVTLSAGAGGDDAEDFVRILFDMYQAYATKKGYHINIENSSPNTMSGYRSLSFLVENRGSFGVMQYESGVHRLIRISPFNAKGKRQTSFALVDVVPHIVQDTKDVTIAPVDIEIQFTKSGGKGGQNVNKRETAVRITHIPTGVTVFADGERTQESNRDIAMSMLRGRLAIEKIKAHKQQADQLKIGGTVQNEWGSQMRTYTLHPYTLVKDHRTGVETANVQKVLEKGEIEDFTKDLYSVQEE
jgi:peptide chain release factor 2